MKLSDKISMSLEDLKKRKFRTFLTAFSIAIGAMLIIDMFGMGQGMQNLITKKLEEHSNLKSVTVYAGKNKKVTDDYLERLNKLKEKGSLVASVNTEVNTVKIGDKEKKSSAIVGINTKYDVVTKGEKVNTKQKPNIAGRLFSKGEKNAVLVGRDYLKYMGIKNYKDVVGKSAVLTVKLPKIKGIISREPLNITANIVGVLDSKCNNAGDIVCSLDMVNKIQEYYTGQKNYINSKGYPSVAIEAKTFAGVKKLVEKIQKDKYIASSYQQQAQGVKVLMTIFKMILTAGGLIVLLVACIGVINTMNMAVQEKTKWIGIMKALGASKKDIKSIFLVQSGVMGFFGAALGSLIAIITSGIINKYAVSSLKSILVGGFGEIDSVLSIQISTIAICIAFTVLVAMIAGLRPAAKAAKLDPVETLNYE